MAERGSPLPDEKLDEIREVVALVCHEWFWTFEHYSADGCLRDADTFLAKLAEESLEVVSSEAVAAERADRERLRLLLVRAYEALIGTDAPVADEARLEAHLTLLDDLMEATDAP